jgi:hypothetical protein
MKKSHDEINYDNKSESEYDNDDSPRSFAARFRVELIKRSVSKQWTKALHEWVFNFMLKSTELSKAQADDHKFSDIERSNVHDTHEHCICKQRIEDCCVIINTITQRRVVIGSTCINHINNKNLNKKLSKMCSAVFAEIRKFNNDADYVKNFSKISHKIIQFMTNQNIISQDQAIFLDNLPNYKNKTKINLSLKQLQKVVDIKKLLYEYLRLQHNNYTLHNIVFDNTNHKLILEYATKYNLLSNKNGTNDIIFIDRKNYIVANISMPTPQHKKYTNFMFNPNNIKYERGFLKFKWITTKIINNCNKCHQSFYSDQIWKNICKSCFHTPNKCFKCTNGIKCNTLTYQQNFHPSNITNIYKCSLCADKAENSTLKFQIIDQNKLICRDCWKNNPNDIIIDYNYVITINNISKNKH